MHDLTNHGIGRTDQEITQRHRTDQLALGIQNITDIDGFTVHAHLPDPFNRILYGHGFL